MSKHDLAPSSLRATLTQMQSHSSRAKPVCWVRARTLFPPLACYKIRVLCLEVSTSRCDCNCNCICYCLFFWKHFAFVAFAKCCFYAERAYSQCKFKLISLSPFNVLASPCLATFRNFARLCFRFSSGSALKLLYLYAVYMQLLYVRCGEIWKSSGRLWPGDTLTRYLGWDAGIIKNIFALTIIIRKILVS